MIFRADWKRLSAYALCTLFAGLAFSSALVEITFFFALGFWLIHKFQLGISRIFSRWSKAALLFALYAAFCTASVLWSEFQIQSVKGMLKVLQQFFIFWMVLDTFDEERTCGALEKVILTVGGILVLDGFYQYGSGRDFIRGFAGEAASSGYRLSASFKSYGLFAAFLVVTLPYLGMLALRVWKRGTEMPKAVLFSLIAIAGMACLFLTRSRGGFIAFGASLFFLFLFQKRWKLIGVLAAAAVAVILILPKGMIIHLDADNREQSLVERYYLWDRAVNVIKAKPLGGTGINTYAVAHQKYDKTQNWRVRNYYAHNGYLQIGAETGLTGLGLFLAGLILLIRRTLQSFAGNRAESARRWAVLTGVMGFMVMSLVDTIMHNNQSVMLFWFWLGLLAAENSSGTKTLTA